MWKRQIPPDPEIRVDLNRLHPDMPVATILFKPVASLVDLAKNSAGKRKAHVIAHEKCYALVVPVTNADWYDPSPWIFREALEVLKTLPNLI